jgi:hypothetical protein
MVRPTALLDAAFNVFKFLPHDDDPRWEFLERYAEVSEHVGFKAVHFASARQAIYLSDETSYSVGYVTTMDERNELQLKRALDNLSFRRNVKDGFQDTTDGYAALDIRFAVTDRLTTDPTKQKNVVTPCPEALYQIRLFTDDSYLGRVGFNLHREGGKVVQSLVNIQGVPGGRERNQAFLSQYGATPFNLLVRRAVEVQAAIDRDSETRGLLNPAAGNSQLYWCALQHEGVRHWEAVHKPRHGAPAATL